MSVAAEVTVYTTRICGYCLAAKRLLEKKGAPFREIHVDDRADLRNWLVDTTGQMTVPQIFINGQSIGGYNELSGLERAGRLDPLLAAAPTADGTSLRD